MNVWALSQLFYSEELSIYFLDNNISVSSKTDALAESSQGQNVAGSTFLCSVGTGGRALSC